MSDSQTSDHGSSFLISVVTASPQGGKISRGGEEGLIHTEKNKGMGTKDSSSMHWNANRTAEGKKETENRPLSKQPGDDCCKGDPPMDAEINGQQFEEKQELPLLKVSLPRYLFANEGRRTVMPQGDTRPGHCSQVIEANITKASSHEAPRIDHCFYGIVATMHDLTPITRKLRTNPD